MIAIDAQIDVSNDVLIRCQVPGDQADWKTIVRFAHTIDGDGVLGRQRMGELANACRDSGQLPEDLTELRCCLFFEQRRWNHFGEAPDANAMRHIRALVRAIQRQVANGQNADRG